MIRKSEIASVFHKDIPVISEEHQRKTIQTTLIERLQSDEIVQIRHFSKEGWLDSWDRAY